MIFQKVILYLYPRLGQIIQDYKGFIESKAYASYLSKLPCEQLAEIILELIYQKERFEYLLQSVDEILGKLTIEERYMLEYKFFKRENLLKGEYAFVRLNFDVRTYYRRQRELLKRFNCFLLVAGIDEKWFFDSFSSVKFMTSAYDKIKNGWEKGLSDKRERYCLNCYASKARGKNNQRFTSS